MFAIMNKILIILIGLIISSATLLQAQIEDPRISEEEAKAELAYLEADAAFFTGEFEEAIKKYKEIYVLDRSNDAVAYNLARAYLGSGDLQSGERYIKKAMELAPDNKWYKLLHANLMRDEGRHEEALESYRRLAIQEPGNRYFVENHAFSLLKLERPFEAIEVIEEWERSQGVSEIFSKKKFEIYDAIGDIDNAGKALADLAETYPRTTRFWHNLASYYIKTKQEDKAKAIYEKILNIDPKNSDAKAKLASLSGQEKAGSQLQQIIQDESIGEDDKVLVLLPLLDEVIVHKDSSQKALLLDLVTQLAKQYPESAKVFALLGDAHFHDNDYLAAMKAYATTLEYNKSVYPVWENYMHALYRTSNFEELTSIAYNAIDNFPNQVSAYYYYTLALSHNNAFGEADSYLMEAGMIAGGNDALQLLLQSAKAYRYFAEGDTEKAYTLMKKVPEHKLPYQALDLKGDIALKMGNKKEAIKCWKKAYSMVPEAGIAAKIQAHSL